ncbi:MAG: 23S rRNA (uracil(1939)-C(5))-methyltransferase RlmD [Victivallaceae bacterium]
MYSSFITDIVSVTSEGFGIGSFGNIKVFIPGGFPGDNLEVSIIAERKNYLLGKIVKIVSPSVLREEARCKLAGTCNGCPLMGLVYSEQLDLKRNRVVSAFRKFASLDIHVPSCLPSPERFEYRNKLDFSIDFPNRKIGFSVSDENRFTEIPYCFLEKGINNILDFFRQNLSRFPPCSRLIIRRSRFSGQYLICLATDQKNTEPFKSPVDKLIKACPSVSGVVLNCRKDLKESYFSSRFSLIFGCDYLKEQFLGSVFRIRAGNFFQVNHLQAECLFRTVLDMIEGPNVIDGFCGIGVLSILLKDKCRKVIGVECVPSSIKSANENAILNKTNHCLFICDKLEKIFHRLPDCDTVVLNPPRAGCEKILIMNLLKKRPKKIIFISCHPESLARDLNLMKNDYSIKNVLLFDMFPQTMHVETVVELILRI